MKEGDIQKHSRADLSPKEGQIVSIPPGYELVMEPPVQEHGLHLWDYIWIVWRRRWLVALVLLLCVGLAVIKTMHATPIYEGVATLRVEPNLPTILNFDDGSSARSFDWRTNFIDTQRQVLASRSLARQVVEQLDLYAEKEDSRETPSKSKSPIAQFLSRVKSFGRHKAPAAPTDPEDAAEMEMHTRVNAFLNSLTVNQIGETQVLEVRFLAPDPVVAAKAANALCEAYVRWNFDSKLTSSKYGLGFLQQKLDDLEGKLRQSESKLYQFAGGKDILHLAQGTEDLTKQLEETGQKLAEAERLWHEKQFQLRSLESATSFGSALLDNSRIQELHASLANVEIEIDQKKEILGPETDEMKSLEAGRKRLQSQLAEERSRARTKLLLEHEQASINRDFLKKSYEAQRNRIVEMQQRLVQYNILKREVDINKELYNDLLRRSREVGVASGLETGNISVVDRAEPKRTPKFPNNKRSVLAGALLGLFLGIGLVFFLDYMDVTVKGPEDLEKVAQLATLGYIPHYEAVRRGGDPPVPVGLITRLKPRSALAENIRYLRTAVLYSLAGRSPKTILVTSAFPQEGKTTVATNLAIAFAQRNQKVLLIDADLKHPGIHQFFAIDRTKGLAEVLTGRLNGAVVCPTGIRNLRMIPSGSHAPNPVELLDSDVMRDLLVSLSEEYDRIIIDSAPVMEVADTTVLVPHVDGVLLVVRPGKTPRAAVRNIKEKLSGMRGRILGVVLNNPRHGMGYGNGYRYASAYRYGYMDDQEDGDAAHDEGREEFELAVRVPGSLPEPDDRTAT